MVLLSLKNSEFRGTARRMAKRKRELLRTREVRIAVLEVLAIDPADRRNALRTRSKRPFEGGGQRFRLPLNRDEYVIRAS